MSFEQVSLSLILAAAMALFIWGRPRYDIVALLALLAAVVLGLVPAGDAFAGFGHPAVITVAAVLVVSRALRHAGMVDRLAKALSPLADRPRLYVAALTAACAFCSAFMNNVGALAIFMPVAIESALKSGRSPSEILMPLSFGAILGGLATLIGTPPNVIIASYRASVSGEAFAMFDFTPVGASVAIAGVLYLALVGQRLIPHERRGQTPPEQLFRIREYMIEVTVTPGSPMIGETIARLEDHGDGEVAVSALVRGKDRKLAPARHRRLQEGDVLILRADPAELDRFLNDTGLKLAGEGELKAEQLSSSTVALVEAVVGQGSSLEGRTARGAGLRWLHGINLLAAARQGRPITTRLNKVRFQAGDVVLLQGDADLVQEALAALRLLPLMERGLRLGVPRRIPLALALFGGALAAAAFGLLPAAVALTAAVVLYVLLGFVTPQQMYDVVDWPVIVLLGAMIPVGGALQGTGTAALLANGVVALGGALPVWTLLAFVILLTMTLSDVMNNAATAVVMAPVAVGMADRLGASSDAFLMAVAVGASCAFLTPIGHQCNTLVLGPGGYRFGDFWRVGLPLEGLILLLAVPLIMLVW